MNTQKKKSPATAGTAQGLVNQLQNDSNKPPKKWQRVLAALLAGRNFNRFEAERQLNDHCLHTTVSTLQSMGLVIHREYETVPGYRGIPTRVCRYWLANESRKLAWSILHPAQVQPDTDTPIRALIQGVAA